MGGLFAAVGDVSWLSHGQIEDALYRVAPGRGVLRLERGADYFIGVQHRRGEAAVGECSPDVVAAIHGVIEDPEAGLLHAGFRGETALPALAKWRSAPGGSLADVALVIWDRRARRLEAIRGWSASRPLFWTEHRGAILLASEIRALLRLCDRAWTPDPTVVEAFLSGQAQPADASGCIGIGLVRAGSRLGFAMQAGRSRDAPRATSLGLPAWTDRATTAVQSPPPETVAKALIGVDREIAGLGEPLYHLSSGSDSSTLVLAALASRRALGSGTPVACYTRSFPGTPSDERAAVADFCRGRAIDWRVEAQDRATIDAVWADCSTSIDFLTGPTVYGALSSVRQAVAGGHQRVVSGIGGDELFATFEHLCAEDGWLEVWRQRKALGAWFRGVDPASIARAVLAVYRARWQRRAEFAGLRAGPRRALLWRLGVWSGARGMLAAEQIHERERVELESPFLRGSVLAAVAPLGELARLGDGQTKGYLERVRRLLAAAAALPEPAKVTLDHALPTALRQRAGAGTAFSRPAMLEAWRAAIASWSERSFDQADIASDRPQCEAPRWDREQRHT